MAVPVREHTVGYTKIDAVIDDITEKIRSGTYEPGARLPSAREMRTQYQVSQATIRVAIERLRAAGLVVTAPGSGVYVRRMQRRDT